jgi:hypothetical protein
MLLPALVLSLNKSLANAQEFQEPAINIIDTEEEEEDLEEKTNPNS